MEAKLERFLQMHDMKTAGIPGICPLFVGLRMRTTEKIVRTAQITILKHTTCEVVGWELHEADKRHVGQRGEESFVTKMPKQVFVQFSDVTWQVPGCEVGVLPMEPCEHQWIINNATDAKAQRRGYRLIPDYACTAFMMQGRTVEAMFADCGDVLTLIGLNEMVAAYVALSRVKKAQGLVLLRAFSPDLFRLGMSPGLECLLKLLRARFSASDDMYTPADARDEFLKEVSLMKLRAKQRKLFGLQMLCLFCGEEWPCDKFFPEGTTDGSTSLDALVYKFCIEPGCTRRCRYCAAGRTGDAHDARRLVEDKGCELCFKFFSSNEVHFTGEHEKNIICHGCAPELTQLACHICGKKDKFAVDFPVAERAFVDGLRRCYDCFTCIVCNIRHNGKTPFSSGKQYCVNCKSFTCHVCETAKEWRLFPDSHLRNWQTHQNKILRCTACHVCSGCKATRDARAFDGDSKYCRHCDMHMCTPCR